MYTNSSLKSLIKRVPDFRNFWCADYAAGFGTNYDNGTLFNGSTARLLNLGSGYTPSNMDLYRRNLSLDPINSNSGTYNYDSTLPTSLVTSGGLNNRGYINMAPNTFMTQHAVRPNTYPDFTARMMEPTSNSGVFGMTFFCLWQQGATNRNSPIFSTTGHQNDANESFSHRLVGNGIRNLAGSSQIIDSPATNLTTCPSYAMTHQPNKFSFVLSRVTNSTAVTKKASFGFSNMSSVNETFTNSRGWTFAGITNFRPCALAINFSIALNSNYFGTDQISTNRLYTAGILDRYCTDEEVQTIINSLRYHYQL